MPFYFMWFITLFTVSLIPTTIAAVFGACITAIASKFRYANRITTILSLIAMMIFGYFIFNHGNMKYSLNDLEGIGVIVSEQLTKVYPLANIFKKQL